MESAGFREFPAEKVGECTVLKVTDWVKSKYHQTSSCFALDPLTASKLIIIKFSMKRE